MKWCRSRIVQRAYGKWVAKPTRPELLGWHKRAAHSVPRKGDESDHLPVKL